MTDRVKTAEIINSRNREGYGSNAGENRQRQIELEKRMGKCHARLRALRDTLPELMEEKTAARTMRAIEREQDVLAAFQEEWLDLDEAIDSWGYGGEEEN